jgi:hypothetical protein
VKEPEVVPEGEPKVEHKGGLEGRHKDLRKDLRQSLREDMMEAFRQKCVLLQCLGEKRPRDSQASKIISLYVLVCR